MRHDDDLGVLFAELEEAESLLRAAAMAMAYAEARLQRALDRKAVNAVQYPRPWPWFKSQPLPKCAGSS